LIFALLNILISEAIFPAEITKSDSLEKILI